MQDLRQRMNEEMVNRLVQASKESEAIDIGKLVFRSSVILLSNTMFSGDLVDTKSNTIEVLKDTIEHIGTLIAKPNCVDSFPMLKKLDPQGLRKMVKPCYDRIRFLLEDLIDRRLKRRESGSSNGGDFLDILLDNSVLTPGGSEELSRNQIRMILQDLLIGGTDTTTTTMEWAMTELLHHPEIMKKAKQELSRVIGSGRNVEEKDIPNLPYLEAVIKEAMRRHPTAPFLLPHRSEKQVQVCGYTIPKHTQVIINYWAISQDEKNWENPKEFAPERFLRSEVDFRGTNFSYIPFGSGRRICPGMSLGIRMLFLMLGSFVHRFDWKLPNGMKPQDMDLGDKFGIDLQKATPLVATPVFLN
ncbi:hypothetical protein UlMin_029655 [Ulmus minor]